MKNAKKIIALLLCAVLLVCASVAGTLAYLTSKTEKVTNTFTVGKVQIKLDEANIATEDQDDRTTTGNAYHLLPGTTVEKDPTITVLANSEDCYVRAKVTIGFDMAKYLASHGKADVADTPLGDVIDGLENYTPNPNIIPTPNYIGFEDLAINDNHVKLVAVMRALVFPDSDDFDEQVRSWYSEGQSYSKPVDDGEKIMSSFVKNYLFFYNYYGAKETGFNNLVWELENDGYPEVDPKNHTLTYYLHYKTQAGYIFTKRDADYKLDPLFDGITANSGLDNDAAELLNYLTINVEAHAIQAAGFVTQGQEGHENYKPAHKAAWEAFDKQHGAN